jgi:hypothetical protein
MAGGGAPWFFCVEGGMDAPCPALLSSRSIWFYFPQSYGFFLGFHTFPTFFPIFLHFAQNEWHY